ncbi:DNA polymerase kappa [Geosmithia morbida]|uniref:DNA polymerase kappa n=1 Tax=Geosmithia morbida TaxID=1094350 RepID=A0A9P5D3F6_9HYPO|nr:DNA polymerase kappa [Geosmithia morbida]KAF4121745.1 DNA polymerase kappa [Geosmithia morbida]
MSANAKPEPSAREEELDEEFKTLKYHLLGPSLTKAGQDKVNQNKVSEIIYNASKGSKFFNREEARDKVLTQKIEQLLDRKKQLDNHDLSCELRRVDRLLAELESTRDLTQYVVHVDCDAFYAAVEQLERPELKDVPFAVGGGVLTTCNYLARQFGCRSGMAGFVAKKLCPNLVLIKPNFEKYTAKAREIREVLAVYDPHFEGASIDEAYLNITEYCIEKNVDPIETVDKLRREVHEKSQVTVSAGIAANSKLAKICSNMNKPNGQYVLPHDRSAIMKFMHELPTRKAGGIGRVLERELLEIGVKTCGDLYEYRQYLQPLFGEKTSAFLLNCYLGLGRTKIQPAEDYERRSIGTERTFGELSDPEKVREKLRSTAEDLEKDMKRAECKGRTICLKVKLHTFEVFTRQVVTPYAICLADDLYNNALPMLRKLEQGRSELKLRLIGLRCTNLVSTKRPNTMAFFGLKRREEGDSGPIRHKRKTSQSLYGIEEWEQWPGEHHFIEAEEDSLDEIPSLGWRADRSRLESRHQTTTPGQSRNGLPTPTEPCWDCPICRRPMAADERLFNQHIDLCLSRQTIREAVQADEANNDRRPPEHKKPRALDKKKGRANCIDPKQKTLTFGQKVQ